MTSTERDLSSAKSGMKLLLSVYANRHSNNACCRRKREEGRKKERKEGRKEREKERKDVFAWCDTSSMMVKALLNTNELLQQRLLMRPTI